MTRTKNARLAGFMFLFYIATGIAGMIFLRGAGGAGRANYALLMMMNPFVLAVAIYALTRDYDRDLALLAFVCRIAEGVMAGVGALFTRMQLALTTSGDTASAAAVAAAIASAQRLLPLLGATSFAIGSTIYCWLFLRARSIPSWMAWLGLLGSALLVVALPIQIAGLLGGPPAMLIWIPMAVFEIAFALWLLIKGTA
jgi:hypothetical protein